MQSRAAGESIALSPPCIDRNRVFYGERRGIRSKLAASPNMKLPNFEYVAPSTPAEVVKALAENRGGAKIIAGGQSLLPTMAFRLAQPSILVDVRKL